MGIITESGVRLRGMASPKLIDWPYLVIGVSILALGVWLGRKGFGPALRFRLPKS